jgi:hypothetical protein
VKAPTPLGEIFVGTDLNHIGYPLTRESAPYCFGLEKEEELNCWRENRWDDRDFAVSANVVIDAVAFFFVNVTASCDLYSAWSADDFVLYNIQCHDENETVSIHHFPWKTRLEDIPKYANYSNDFPSAYNGTTGK